jgi:hypothetical protein
MSFPRVVEQICWLVSVTGRTPTEQLKKYVTETKRGTQTRENTVSVYTGPPVIEAENGPGRCFHVSFTQLEPEIGPSRMFVARPGHCWKTMTGMSIIANGFAIPSRPRHKSGLEAPLFVLGQLFRRGTKGRTPVALDSPVAMYPPSNGVCSSALRVILAAGCEGKNIYWHFDPAKVCTVQALEELDRQVRVDSLTIGSDSRHFVGWSDCAGQLAGKSAVHTVTTSMLV